MTPSRLWPLTASSIESAITSRDINEARMPSLPIVIPSETAIELKSTGVPPAARIPAPYRNGELIKVHITRAHIGPCIENRDNRAFEILIIHACSAEHRPRGSAAWAFDYSITSFCHLLIP